MNRNRLTVCLLTGFAVALSIHVAQAADEKTYDLSKAPVTKVGDQFTTKGLSTDSMTVSAEGKVVKDGGTEDTGTEVTEVLAVDSAGKVTRIRRTVVEAKAMHQSKAPTAGKKTVVLTDLAGEATRDGLRFKADTTTLASGKMTELTASQVAMAKKEFSDHISVIAFPEDFLLLMPGKPVAVGATWEAPKENIDKWLKTAPGGFGKHATGKSATFKFVSVSELGVANIDGTINITLHVGPASLETACEMSFKIDTKSGLWLERMLKMNLTGTIEGAELKMSGLMTSSTTSKAGSGTASALPANMNKLGWAPAGKDENSYKNPAQGLSLNVPKDYEPAAGFPQGNVIAKFSSKTRANVAISVTDMDLPLDIAELSPVIVDGLAKSFDDGKVISKTPVRLPDNVPGELITMTYGGGKATFMSLYAVDGERCATISAACPNEDPTLVIELKKIVMSLRVFERDLTEKAGE